MKRLLKEALLHLMSQKNIQRISVSELCQTAEINRSTFYNHYGSQLDVLKEMEMDMIQDLENIWDNISQKSDSTVSKRTETLCAYIKDNKALTKLVFSNSDIDSEFASLLMDSVCLQSIYHLIFSKEKDDYQKSLMITYFSYGAYHMIRQWVLDDFPISPAEMGEIVYSMLLCNWEIST